MTDNGNVPDVLGHQGRFDTFVRALSVVQGKLESLEADLAMNGATDADPCPDPTAQGRTYAEQREFLHAAQGRLCERYEDLLPELRERLATAG